MIPKVDGDASPSEQWPLCVLPVVYRILGICTDGSSGALVEVPGA